MRRLLTLLCLLALAPARADDPLPVLYVQTVDRIEALYLDIEHVTPGDLLRAAARELATGLDWLMVHEDGDVVRLSHGLGAPLGEVRATTWDELPRALYTLERMVTGSGYDLGRLADRVRHTTLYGATTALDRYSRLMVGERLDNFDQRLKGTLVGIGCRLHLVGDRLTVAELFDDGPARRAGLQPGDHITRIDGTSTATMPVKEAVSRIKGEPGTTVVLDVRRDDRDLRFELTREELIQPNVFSRALDGGVGLLRIDHISQKTVHNLRKEMEALAGAGALRNGLILDLRGNTGGSMKESAAVVDRFVEDGLLLSTEGRGGQPVENLMPLMMARKDGDEPHVPTVVLVDDATASGAEIIAGSLLGHEKAAILGQRTFGKGLVQKVYELDADASLKLTVAEYVLVGGLRVGRGGIAPDVPFGHVRLDRLGLRFLSGWDLAREGVAWDDIVPIVDEKTEWRGVGRSPGDIEVEIAREAVLLASQRGKPTRDGVLAALAEVVPRYRAVEEAALAEALEARGLDWSPAPGPGARPEARVRIEILPDPEDPGHALVRAVVDNDGPTTLHRTLVRLGCSSFRLWDGLVIPVGAVPSGGTGEGDVRVELPARLPLREDVVTLELRADRRPSLELPEQVLAAGTPPSPRVRAEVRLLGDGPERVAAVTVRNLGDVPLTNVEAEFAWPKDVPGVEFRERASRRSRLDAGGEVVFDLRVRVGPEAPPRLPLDLRVRADDHGRLATLRFEVPLDGTPAAAEAPEVVVALARPSAPPGPLTVPIHVRDDGEIRSVVVFHDDAKVLYHPGGADELALTARITLAPGANRLVVRATDDQGITETHAVSVLGLSDGEGLTRVVADRSP